MSSRSLMTLDILDKDLSRINDYYLKLPAEVRFRFLREEFLLDNNYWEKFFANLKGIPFEWNEFKYMDIKKMSDIDSLGDIDNTGVYIFIIRPTNQILNSPQFIFYVGIAGEGDSKRPLKERLKDYYKISEIKKRRRIHRMLYMYHKNVFVAYSKLIENGDISLRKIEEDLHGFFNPVCSERDFPMEIKEIRKAF